MLLDNRVILSNNGTLTDVSLEMLNFSSEEVTIPEIAAEDSIYIGSELRFNHRFFELGTTVNALSSNLIVELYDGNNFVSANAVDLIDQTKTSGAAFSRSGVFQWTLDEGEVWLRRDTDDMDTTELSNLKIFNLYWMRIRYSNDLTSGIKMKYIGHKFSTDEDLGTLYPETKRQDIKDAFNNGISKANWDEQSFSAAEEMVDDLKQKDLIFSSNQIIDWKQLKRASIHKTAKLVYSGFGKDYEDLVKRAMKEYSNAINFFYANFDKDNNTRLTNVDRKVNAIFVRR